jgi:hypothetical protein
VLRGGAFNNNQQNARCAYRDDNNPNNQNNNNGLRLVCGVHVRGVPSEGICCDYSGCDRARHHARDVPTIAASDKLSA